MKNKTKKLNLIFCVIAFFVMLAYMLFVDGEDVFASLGRINIGFLLIALLCMLLYWLLETCALHVVLKKLHKPQKFGNTLTVSVIGQYFNCITPFATGGQPIQVYYFVNSGVSLGSSMTALLSKFIVYQFMLTVYCAVLLVLRFSYFSTELKALQVLTVIGFVINFAVIVGLLVLAFFRKAARKIASGVVSLCARLKLVKDKEQKLKMIDEEMHQYTENFTFLKKQPLLILQMCLISAVQLTVYFGISCVIYLGFGGQGADFLTILSCQAYVLMISSFVPLPGALGAAEGSYAAFFAPIFGSLVTASMFIWRFLTFYFPIIVGVIVTASLNRKEPKKAE